MIKISTLDQYLNSYLFFDKTLNISEIDTVMANGMVVRGRESLEKIGFGVSASVLLFQKAIYENCDAVIVHHSFNFPQKNRFDFIFQNRIALLLEKNISLFGYHFLLDAHPVIGNNISILNTIGAHPKEVFLHHDIPWGWIGEYKTDVLFTDILKRIQNYLSPRKIIYDFGPSKIRKVAVVSGSGAPSSLGMQLLIDKNIDLFITGEAYEWNRELFREAKINFLGGGHYCTEVFGIKALMDKLKQKFPRIKTVFLNVDNDI